VDQRGKQDRHLIRSGLVVIAGGLADNIEQPLSLGAVLAIMTSGCRDICC
jgi:hypothetical protein